MKQLGSDEARRTFRDLLDDAQQGESTEISRNGKPVAVLVPYGWYTHTNSALRAFSDNEDPPVSAREMRAHVVTLAGLLDGMSKLFDFAPGGNYRDELRQLSNATSGLAALLPENAPETAAEKQ